MNSVHVHVLQILIVLKSTFENIIFLLAFKYTIQPSGFPCISK